MVIELVFVIGAVALFAWWQLHEINIDRRKAANQRAAKTREAQRAGTAATQQQGTALCATSARRALRTRSQRTRRDRCGQCGGCH